VDRTLYWHDGSAIQALDLETDEKSVVVAQSAGGEQAFGYAGPLVHYGDRLFWTWSNGTDRGGVASVDLRDPDDVRWIEGPNTFPPLPLAADANHVYWAESQESPPRLTVVRTDRVTDETEALGTFDGGPTGHLALSDDFVFVAVAAESEGASYIVRFRK
jgi:hypothetical protein